MKYYYILVTNIESPNEPSEEQEIVVENNNAVITETSIATEIITETFTEIIEPVTEVVLVTQIDEVTEEILRPGTVEDLENPALDDNQFAPGIEDISDPALEEISAPQELLAPVLEEENLPPVLEEEILTPVLEGNLAPALEEILAPVLEDIIAPVLEEIGVSPALEEEISDDPKLEKVVVPEIFQEVDPGLEKIVPAYRNEPDPIDEPSFILLSTSEDNLDNEKIENIFKTNDESKPEEEDQKDNKKESMEKMVEKTTENIADESEDFAIQGLISTSPSDLKPDRDDAFGK